VLELVDVSFRYNGTERPALDHVSLTIEDGEFVLVVGPTGGGKSTLCRCFNGLVPHFYGGVISGRMKVQGVDVIGQPTRELATRVGMVFQDPENQLVCNEVEREVAFGLENLGYGRGLIARRVEEALDAVGIASLRTRPVVELSGGEKQKVAVASVLALHPEVLVLDEPTSELDPQAAEEVLRLLERLNDELGVTVVVSEHRVERVAHLADRMVVMEEGRVAADGTPREVLGRRTLETNGVHVPPVAALCRELQRRGAMSGRLPLTIKEARLALNSVVQSHRSLECGVDGRGKGKRMLGLEGVWFSYRDRSPSLKGISLELGEGEFVAVMGRNGSGKTTLAKHLNGLLKPSRGRVVVDGVDTRELSVAQLSRRVGYVFQNPNDHLFADTVEDEVALGLRNRGVERERVMQRVEEMLRTFRLTGVRKAYPRYLSGGERQRVALAAVAAMGPEVLVLDEPTRGMDRRLKDELAQFLERHRNAGGTVVLVTHDVETVAECADRVVLLSEGQVVVDDGKREVLGNALLFSPQMNRLARGLAGRGVSDTTLTVAEMLEQIG
jgi:energy-coupling factor transport system ATP-binding protein